MTAEIDPRLTGASAQRGLIPPKEHLEEDQSAIPGIAGMLLPFEFIYTISFIISMNVNMALISFVVLFATILVGYIYPAQKRVQAKDKPGIPVRERVQLGPHLWEEQNRYIAVIPATKPIDEMDSEDIFDIFQERNLHVTDEGGRVIIEGLPIDPQAIRQARKMLGDAADEAEASKMVGSVRGIVKKGFGGAWRVMKEMGIMVRQKWWAFTIGFVLTFIVYLLSPLWMPLWFELLKMIGW